MIATGKAMHKKVRSGRCFAAHLLFFSCAGFGRMVYMVCECFMLGVDPTKVNDDFRITCFWMENGVPKF